MIHNKTQDVYSLCTMAVCIVRRDYWRSFSCNVGSFWNVMFTLWQCWSTLPAPNFSKLSRQRAERYAEPQSSTGMIMGQKEIWQYVTKTAWMWVWRSSSAGRECEVWGADQAWAGGLQLTTPRLHTFRPIDIQLWQNKNKIGKFWNFNQKIANWNSDQSLVKNVLYLDLVIESQYLNPE